MQVEDFCIGWILKRHLIITIDGPAGSGKSAVAMELARGLHIKHLDTGAMYRAVALLAMQAGSTAAPDAVAKLAKSMDLQFDFQAWPAKVLLNGRDVSSEIRQPEVTRITHCAADNPVVREELVRRQRKIAEALDALVTEGRDQGTVAFPDGDFKFYIDATADVRAARRLRQLTDKGIPAVAAEVLRELIERDNRDQSRLVGPLKPSPDAVVVDTSEMNLMEVVALLTQLIKAGSTEHE